MTRHGFGNIVFSLDLKDIIIPKVCPILGIKLNGDFACSCDNTPYVELIKEELGYIKGNICIISRKAKKIKADMKRSSLELMDSTLLNKMLKVSKFYNKSI